jgi:hypothetical protein
LPDGITVRYVIDVEDALSLQYRLAANIDRRRQGDSGSFKFFPIPDLADYLAAEIFPAARMQGMQPGREPNHSPYRIRQKQGPGLRESGEQLSGMIDSREYSIRI